MPTIPKENRIMEFINIITDISEAQPGTVIKPVNDISVIINKPKNDKKRKIDPKNKVALSGMSLKLVTPTRANFNLFRKL